MINSLTHFSVIKGLAILRRRQEEFYVGSSIQFRAVGLSRDKIPAFITACAARGVELNGFGDAGAQGLYQPL